MSLRYLGLLLLTTPVFPMLVHSRRKRQAERAALPDLDAIDRALESCPPPVILLDTQQQIALRVILDHASAVLGQVEKRERDELRAALQILRAHPRLTA